MHLNRHFIDQEMPTYNCIKKAFSEIHISKSNYLDILNTSVNILIEEI